MPSKLKSSQKDAAGSAILHAAEELLLLKGPQGISMAMIAQRAGIAVGTVYNYFEDKEALLRTLQKTRRLELIRSLTETLEPHGDKSFVEKFDLVLGRIFHEDEERARNRRLLNMANAGLAMAMQPLETLCTAFEQWWEPLLEQGVKEGTLREAPGYHHSLVLGAIIRRAVEAWSAGLIKSEDAHALVRSSFLDGQRAR